MAEKIQGLPPIEHPSKKRASKYPDEWLDGDAWRLEAGVDFDCQARSVVTALRQRANDRGLRLLSRVSVDEKFVFVKAEPR